MAYSLLVFVPHEQMHRASSILKQIGLSPDDTKARAVENVMKLIVLIANSLDAAKVAPAEMAWETGLKKVALLNRQLLSCTKAQSL